MATLTVGPGQQFNTIEDAVAAASPGDTIDVLAGIYTNDFVGIYKSLTLQAVGGRVEMRATIDPPNGKAIIDEGGAGIAVTINGFDISGAVVPDSNGAAIRYESGSLTLNSDYIHNNQDGLLANSDPNGSITIINSEFAFNGTGGGLTHNLYVNDIANLTVTASYFHDAVGGHEIKSRAENTVITDSRIFDNAGTANYSIDLPNGGNATIRNNVIEQGPNSGNPYIIAYGEEDGLHSGTSVLIADNTIVNDLASRSAAAVTNRTSTPLSFDNNQVWGLTAGQLSAGGPLAESGTSFLTTRPTLDTSSIPADDLGCFAAGTRIATPGGEKRVEDLAVGDIIQAVLRCGEGLRALQVEWVGRRRIDLTAHPRPETVAPVCIQRNAFSGNMPHADLLVSPDHAICVDGKLICARQLVNGTTIRQEMSCASVVYCHVELAVHAILLAEGLPAESYLDTGNRGFFSDSGEPLMLHPDLTDKADFPTREAASCAPFVWDEANVHPVWQHLAERAAALGRPAPRIETTIDADLRIIANGRTLRPLHGMDGRYIFLLPDASTEIRLVSRASAPADSRPWLEDRRRLGVCVERILVRTGPEVREVPVDDPGLSRGWWAVERDGKMLLRWTDGDAVLPLPAIAGPAILELRAGSGGMRYVLRVAPDPSRGPAPLTVPEDRAANPHPGRAAGNRGLEVR